MVPARTCGTVCSTISIGAYPATPLKGNPKSTSAPRGALRSHQRKRRHKVSPNFEIKQFLTKQKRVPQISLARRAFVVPTREARKHLEPRGWDADDIFIMSGYRTPFYNKRSRPRNSLHNGTRCYIFVDKDNTA